VKEIRLTKGYTALVDDADYPALRLFSWHASRSGNRIYAQRMEGGRPIRMHAQIMGARVGYEVDHRQHPDAGVMILDNRRSNLRFATRAQNNANRRPQSTTKSSIFKGVYFAKQTQRWRARIRHRSRGDEDASYQNLAGL
jgi:hypothetical protein